MTCKLCDGSGLLPFEKNGNTVAHAFINCPLCYEEPKEYYHHTHVEDFDFACSNTFRGFTYQHCGQTDPAYSPPEPDITALEDRLNDLEAEQDLGKGWQASKVWRHQVEQMKSQVLYLQSKLNEHTKPKERPKKPIGYKGIK